MKSSSIMSTCWRVTWELRHFSVSPFLAKVFLHQSPIDSSFSCGVLMYRESRESSWKKKWRGQPVADSQLVNWKCAHLIEIRVSDDEGHLEKGVLAQIEPSHFTVNPDQFVRHFSGCQVSSCCWANGRQERRSRHSKHARNASFVHVVLPSLPQYWHRLCACTHHQVCT